MGCMDSMHATVHDSGDILSCRLTAGIRQEICSRMLYDVAWRLHVAAYIYSSHIAVWLILGLVHGLYVKDSVVLLSPHPYIPAGEEEGCIVVFSLTAEQMLPMTPRSRC